MKVCLLGSTGNMGEAVLLELVKEENIEVINILVRSEKKVKALLKKIKSNKEKLNIIYGSVGKAEDLEKAFLDMDYVINMAAVIPPASDKNPKSAILANEIGAKNICEVIEKMERQPKLIHTSTMGIYGDRSYLHPWGEVGDPLLISPFDLYAVTKMRGEFTVLESNVKCWAIIRQTAMLYDKILMKNVSDGLMFHTCFNSPLEWATAHDSAILIRNILRRDVKGELTESNFWKQTFNLAGGLKNRVTGFETLDLGFRIIGASVYDFFDTNYNSLRNFHGMWFSDGDKLEELFHYQNDTIEGFWDHVLDTHKYFKLARIVPKKLLKAFVTKPLLKDDNAPMYWAKDGDDARMFAYFNGYDNFNAIPKDWNEFKLVSKGEGLKGETFDYDEIRKTPTHINHYFDLNKKREEVTIEDLIKVAHAHGGKLLSKEFKTGDVYKTLEWETQDGETFKAKPNTILYNGHWYNISYKEYAWDFDRLAKKDKIYQEIWYDAHEKDENKYYYYDEEFKAHYDIVK